MLRALGRAGGGDGRKQLFHSSGVPAAGPGPQPAPTQGLGCLRTLAGDAPTSPVGEGEHCIAKASGGWSLELLPSVCDMAFGKQNSLFSHCKNNLQVL